MTNSNPIEVIFSLIQEGQLKLAEKKVKKALKREGNHPDYLHMLAMIELERKNYTRAEKCARDSLKLSGGNVSISNTLARILGYRKKYQQALKVLEQALEIVPGQPELVLNKVDVLVLAGSNNEAFDACLDLYNSAPDDERVEKKLLDVAKAKGNDEVTADLLERFLQRNRSDQTYLTELSVVLQRLGRPEDAISLLTKELELNHRTSFLSELARLNERANNLAEAERYAKLTLEQEPFDAQARLILGRVCRRKKQFDEAFTWLEVDPEPGPLQLAELEFEKGHINNDMNQFDQAFRHWERGNQLVRGVHRVTSDSWWDEFSDLSKGLPDQETMQRFALKDAEPVFVVGFPRSGTTLMGTLLSQHSSVSVVDEGPALNRCIDQVEATIKTLRYPESLPQLNQSQIESIAELYLRILTDGNNAELVIDKHPLNLLHVPLILSLFEKPKFILCMRHPLDSCLSSFIQNFHVSRAMYELMELESTARYYELSLGLWVHFAEVYDFEWCEVKYESLVAEREVGLRKLVKYLDLEWEDSLLDEKSRVEQQDYVSTASYQQVTRPIYKESMYRWKNFNTQLEPVKGILMPFVEHFGYETT